MSRNMCTASVVRSGEMWLWDQQVTQIIACWHNLMRVDHTNNALFSVWWLCIDNNFTHWIECSTPRAKPILMCRPKVISSFQFANHKFGPCSYTPRAWWSEYVNPYIPTQTPEEDWCYHMESLGWQPTLCVAWCLICWFSSLKSMVIHDTECPHWDQASLKYTNRNPCSNTDCTGLTSWIFKSSSLP